MMQCYVPTPMHALQDLPHIYIVVDMEFVENLNRCKDFGGAVGVEYTRNTQTSAL